MAFGYLIGVFLFFVLYEIGMRICLHFDPYPPYVPQDKEKDIYCDCDICVNGKTLNCKRTKHITRTYGYDADQNVLEFENTYILYELKQPLYGISIDGIFSVRDFEHSKIECYISNDGKSLVSYNPIRKESVYKYRKKPRRNKIPA
ncbi:MAG: hypothetical protein HFH72_08585 [Lachnospiraceae bacterium]|nr:hypothetical protein [Lachnospiraceae bacterium]